MGSFDCGLRTASGVAPCMLVACGRSQSIRAELLADEGRVHALMSLRAAIWTNLYDLVPSSLRYPPHLPAFIVSDCHPGSALGQSGLSKVPCAAWPNTHTHIHSICVRFKRLLASTRDVQHALVQRGTAHT